LKMSRRPGHGSSCSTATDTRMQSRRPDRSLGCRFRWQATASPPTTKPILAIRVIVLSAHQRDCVKVDINASAEFLDRVSGAADSANRSALLSCHHQTLRPKARRPISKRLWQCRAKACVAHRRVSHSPLRQYRVQRTCCPSSFKSLHIFCCARKSEGIVFCFRLQGRQPLREGCRFFAG
jgi:hypothetical protein